MSVLARPLPQRPAVRREAPAANATLLERHDLTASLAVFVLRPDIPPATFEPGQYIAVGVPDVSQAYGDGWIRRPYSVVSLSGGTAIELLIRRLPGGRLSGVLWTLEVGSRLLVGPPRGLFALDTADRRRRLFVGSGTGVAPFMAMLEHLVARSDGAPTVLIHGVSHREELAFAARIKGWIEAGASLDYRPTVSRPDDVRNTGWRGRRGRAEAQLAALAAEGVLDRRSTLAYLCGNPAMIDACARILLGAGFRTSDIRIERFHRLT